MSLIKEIINESILAPSWKNGENTRYYLAYSDEYINKVRECLPEFNQENSKNACYIISTFVKNKSGFNIKTNTPFDELGNIWGGYDNGIHDAYLILSSQNHNVDTLIMGIRDSEKLRQIFSIPEEEIITSCIALGYRDNKPLSVTKKELDDILKIRE